jgi:hypothetical protein
LKEEWMIWRIWLTKKVPLNELKWEWSYPDLLKANSILDYQETWDAALEGTTEVPE